MSVINNYQLWCSEDWFSEDEEPICYRVENCSEDSSTAPCSLDEDEFIRTQREPGDKNKKRERD